MKQKILPRREREKLRQRQDMLAAALTLFSEKGYHNVSMHEIAEKAEFAVGTLYKHFKSKEDLYRALIMRQADNFHDAITKAIEETDDEVEKLQNYVRAKWSIFRANAAIIRLYFTETVGASFNIMAMMDKETRRRYHRFIQDLALIFASGIARNRFKKIAEPIHLALAIESLTNVFLFTWLEDPERYPYPEDPDVILNIMFQGLVNP